LGRGFDCHQFWSGSARAPRANFRSAGSGVSTLGGATLALVAL
jgi:hypothetical protein